MAQNSNVHDRYDLDVTGVNTVRDVSDVIYNISPTEFPMQSNAQRGTADQTYKEWLVDALADPSASNKHIDGDQFSNDTLDSAEVLGNYCQISWKILEVTRRANKTKKYGRKQEMAYQIAKKGKELKRDIEYIIMGGGGHQVAAAGSSSVAPTSASIGSWLKTNVSRGTDGASPTLSSTTYGYPNATPTDGTDRALSQATLLGIITDCYIQGGSPGTIMVGPQTKQNISSFLFSSSARIATPYQPASQTQSKGVRAIGSVDIYVSDFGVLDIVPNRFQRENDVFVLDMEFWEIAYFDPFHVDDVPNAGDAERKAIIADWTLVSRNEKASGIVADVDSTTAMVA